MLILDPSDLRSGQADSPACPGSLRGTLSRAPSAPVPGGPSSASPINLISLSCPGGGSAPPKSGSWNSARRQPAPNNVQLHAEGDASPATRPRPGSRRAGPSRGRRWRVAEACHLATTPIACPCPLTRKLGRHAWQAGAGCRQEAGCHHRYRRICPADAALERAGLRSDGAGCLSAAPSSPANGGPPPPADAQEATGSLREAQGRTRPRAHTTPSVPGDAWRRWLPGRGLRGPRAFACARPGFGPPLPSSRLARTARPVSPKTRPSGHAERQALPEAGEVAGVLCGRLTSEALGGGGRGAPSAPARRGASRKPWLRDEAREDSLTPVQGAGQRGPRPGRENSQLAL